MENIINGIRYMTAIERELNQLQYSKLIMLVWDKIGCDYDDNIVAITRIVNGAAVEDIVEDFKYDYLSNRIMDDFYYDVMYYLLYRDEIEFLTGWDDYSNKDIVLYTAKYIIINEIYPAIKTVLNRGLEENNDIINDII